LILVIGISFLCSLLFCRLMQWQCLQSAAGGSGHKSRFQVYLVKSTLRVKT
jgi:hypothetical protein